MNRRKLKDVQRWHVGRQLLTKKRRRTPCSQACSLPVRKSVRMGRASVRRYVPSDPLDSAVSPLRAYDSRLKQRALFASIALLPLSTGAGLIIYILTRFSLLLAVGVVACGSIVLATFAWHRLSSESRHALRPCIMSGLFSGALATLAYDVFRLGFVRIFHYRLWPPDVWMVFGRLIIGNHLPPAATMTVGFGWHILNGVSFGIAYALVAGRFKCANIWTGLLFAALLEVLMISLYPGWLGVKAMDELISVSILSHVVYGLVLGAVVQRQLRTTISAKGAANQ